MTLSSETIRATYTGNGANVTFAIPFSISGNLFSNTAFIKVYLRDEAVTPATETLQTSPAQYGVVGTNVIMVTAPAATEKLVIIRELPITQLTDYIQNVNFPVQNHEDTLDKLTAICQQLDERLDRAVTTSITSPLSSLQLPQPEADLVIGWDPTATFLENKSPTNLSANETQVLNNNQTALAITSALYNGATQSSIKFEYEIHRTTTLQERFTNGVLYLQYKNSTWQVEDGGQFGDFSGVTFTIPGGQLSYASDTMPGASYVGTIKWRSIAFV